MKKLTLLMLFSMILTSCVSTEGDVNFERMSEEELAAYNATQPIRQMIVCINEDRSLSRVRRRRCMTVEQAYGSAQQAQQLGVLNTVPGYSQ
ncbi:MAG: hypothetical protein RKH07_07775 [Gammaproteobacteria bacterium]